jgi:hypothetical protein
VNIKRITARAFFLQDFSISVSNRNYAIFLVIKTKESRAERN